jgi:hypothetical protein
MACGGACLSPDREPGDAAPPVNSPIRIGTVRRRGRMTKNATMPTSRAASAAASARLALDPTNPGRDALFDASTTGNSGDL